MSKKMFSRERERERGKLRFSALLILIGLLLFGCDPTMVTITYNANGGKGEMKPQAVESGFEVKLNANTFTKDGSDFTGWNEAADGSGKAYADGATVKPTGDLTLYAQWQAKSTPENPGTEDPGTEDPGTEDPDPENPGTENPDPEQPGGGESDVNLQLTEGTAVFNKTTGLILSFSGSTLPENASASVSLNGTQVDSKFNSERNAVIVALEALTNDTVGMTVTVTVSADGYNDAVLTYEGVNTVWIPDVTVTFDDAEKIGGESVTVTISPELSGVTISGTYSVGENTAEPLTISEDGLSFTAPILENAAEAGETVTISLVLVKANADSVTVAETLTVYPETHVRYDGRIFQQVKGFDFSTENTAKTAGVTVKRGAGGSWNEKSNWETVTYSDGEGYTFMTNDDDGVRFVFPETGGDLDFELIMVETKWNNSNANIHLSWWYSDADIYGYSFYKGGKSFFILDSYNYAEGHGFNVDVTENTFNRFYAFDDGANHSGRVNDGDVKSFSFSDSHTLDSFTSIQLEFNEGTSCTYTLRTVNFYKEISQQ